MLRTPRFGFRPRKINLHKREEYLKTSHTVKCSVLKGNRIYVPDLVDSELLKTIVTNLVTIVFNSTRDYHLLVTPRDGNLWDWQLNVLSEARSV
ncbi:hypothetical protein EVAR_103603_1 [Eumeta japonica]|uniref:Uncharacterized protein n=1 Tax=Eumeta variegata TaxID=151549 RepID=A0A4C1Z556_EUMVA|nr:hypothetical protein EVAR_103603_1 [Eumeta japonica]